MNKSANDFKFDFSLYSFSLFQGVSNFLGGRAASLG